MPFLMRSASNWTTPPLSNLRTIRSRRPRKSASTRLGGLGSRGGPSNSTTAVLAVGVVLCILAVIVAVARRDPATAAAGILGAVILGIIAILTGEKDDRYDY